MSRRILSDWSATLCDASGNPLTNDFYLLLAADSPARRLRDWLLTEDGRALLQEENYVWARSGLPEQSAGAGNPFDAAQGVPIIEKPATGEQPTSAPPLG